MQSPLISVVMPAHNASKNISAAVDSILHQTFKRFELIVVNDASTDKTLQKLKSLVKKDKRIKILSNEKRLDIAGSLNRGIKEARSDIIARMDSDDISMPERLELQYELIMSSKKIAAVGANIVIMDENEKDLDTRNYPDNSEGLKKCLFKYSPFAHPVVMFRKKMFEKVGGYDPTYSPTEDLDLWFRLGRNYEFRSVPKLLLRYRLSKSSSSHSIMRKLELLVFRIRIKAILIYGYRPSISDIFYNLFQFLTLWITPVNYRIKIYNLLRNNNVI